MIKVLLLDDIVSLGWLGDIVDVKDGYARNYLVPYGLATIPTQDNMDAIAAEKAKRANERKLAYEKLTAVKEAVDGASVTIVARANNQGHLFGSVTEAMVAEALREANFEIADEMVTGGHIKETGVHVVTLKLAVDLKASVEVNVVAEGQNNDGDTEGQLEESETEQIDE
ncbi:MAG: 50S ribosomal protein L9 [Phycisphaerae bacterium]|jgi:large subunit ribosomal protein L9